jgi:hypothetical protein
MKTNPRAASFAKILVILFGFKNALPPKDEREFWTTLIQNCIINDQHSHPVYYLLKISPSESV